jgi:hypothetical protein
MLRFSRRQPPNLPKAIQRRSRRFGLRPEAGRRQPAADQFLGYSVERLMRFLVALGHDVEIVVKPRKHGTAELRVA